MQTELESGWFAILIEADDKDDYGVKNLTKVCESDMRCQIEYDLFVNWGNKMRLTSTILRKCYDTP